ncbi:ribonuclease H family protein [Oceanisphaera psychrotolerans]|uniref:Ribonuclease H n=1 Tax=Oceanisphaera psychrotolerans TaxID=1414654 RepID=A0A1J4QF80_9GAMM|nr:ribonuclease H [Oceanisphaera psychrotolerans]OIN07920.1 ribonuclease HI [Oceanisphaera psychrotolerans]
MTSSIIRLYTDGSCLKNGADNAPGGWAAVLESGHKQLRISGHATPSTNNSMELQAILEGLKAVQASQQTIHIYTDSAYARNGCKTWRFNWRAKGWLTSNNKPVENQELWQQLDELLDQHEVQLFKVKGHSGHPQNDLADKLAVAAARGRTVREYRQAGDYEYVRPARETETSEEAVQ